MLKPIQSSGSNAYALLLEAIESGALPPGARLRELDLAARFAVSRTPVREALKKLESQGLVVHTPHFGATVVQPDYAQITELYAMREILEGAAARLAAEHATATEIEALRAMVARDRTIADQPARLAQTNREFHQQIHNASRNRYLAQMLENFRLSLALLAGTTLGLPDRGAASVEEHAAVVEAVAARDPDAAEQAARRHISSAFKARLTMAAAG